MEIKSVRLSGVLKKEDTGIVFDARWLRFKTSCLFRKSRRVFIKSRRKLMKSEVHPKSWRLNIAQETKL